MSDSRKRRTYWIAETITPVVRERALRLSQKGFDVQFFTSLDALVSELAQRRAAVLIVSDDGAAMITERILLTLMSLPEIQGARMVMVRENHSERINFLAACANFRDIIPSNIDERLWLTRFLYATAGKPLHYVQPAGQITLNNISAVCLPARLTWVGETRLRLECRVRPPVGATLNLGGALAAAAGVATVSLTVRETQRTNLRYRFSDAIVADWSVPAAARERALLALAEIKDTDPGPRCRVFIAVQSGELRSALLQRLDDPRFDVATALQKQGIVDEPRFFTPDIVFVEAALLDSAERFEEMLANLSEQATVVVLGGRLPPEVVERNPGRRILELSRLPKNLSQSILNRYMPLRAQRASEHETAGANVAAEHVFSLAEVSFPARLHRLHPLAVQIAMPFPVSNFALARLESPLLRRMLDRHPYVKLTATYQDLNPDAPPFTNLADGYIADLDQNERRTLVSGLSKLVTETLARLDPSGSFGGKAGSDKRTPELGSIRPLASVPPPAPPPPGGRRSAAALDGVGSDAVANRPRLDGSAAAVAAAALNAEPPPLSLAPLYNVFGRPLPADGDVAHERLLPEIEEIAELLKTKKPAEAPASRPRTVPAGIVRSATQVVPAGKPEEETAEPAAVIEESVQPPRRVRGRQPLSNPLTLQQTLGGVAAVAFVVAFLWALFVGLAGRVDRSGNVYKEQLLKMAPHLAEPGQQP